MYIIAGLGNPGKRYEHTRHNMGFLTIDKIAEELKIKVDKIKFKALVGEANFSGQKVVLVKPQTYMNLSGQSLREVMNFYKLPLENLTVIYDDIDLPLGALRVRASGGPGTHNGMRSIVSYIGEDFNRIRIGIGKPPGQMQLADFVLGKFSGEELPIMKSAYQSAAQCALEFTASGIEKAMAKYNINVKGQAGR